MTVTCARAVKEISRSFLLCTGLLVVTFQLQSCAIAEFRTTPVVQSLPGPGVVNPLSTDTGDGTLKVITLNIAHGRGDGFHQLLQNEEQALTNLDAISALLKARQPDIVALQEADGSSYWSGNFDHVEYVARQGSFAQYVRASHADGYGLFYGTAFVSNLELRHLEAITFDPELSPVPKGFVVAAITWPGRPCIELDIISVHLDFSSEIVRRKQAMALVDVLASRNRPMILMGDFNTWWEKEDSALHRVARELGLTPYKPEQTGLETFAGTGHRLDWILVSPEFEFMTYKVIKEKVSDHRAIIADLVLTHDFHARTQVDSCVHEQKRTENMEPGGRRSASMPRYYAGSQ